MRTVLVPVLVALLAQGACLDPEAGTPAPGSASEAPGTPTEPVSETPSQPSEPSAPIPPPEQPPEEPMQPPEEPMQPPEEPVQPPAPGDVLLCPSLDLPAGAPLLVSANDTSIRLLRNDGEWLDLSAKALGDAPAGYELVGNHAKSGVERFITSVEYRYEDAAGDWQYRTTITAFTHEGQTLFQLQEGVDFEGSNVWAVRIADDGTAWLGNGWPKFLLSPDGQLTKVDVDGSIYNTIAPVGTWGAGVFESTWWWFDMASDEAIKMSGFNYATLNFEGRLYVLDFDADWNLGITHAAPGEEPVTTSLTAFEGLEPDELWNSNFNPAGYALFGDIDQTGRFIRLETDGEAVTATGFKATPPQGWRFMERCWNEEGQAIVDLDGHLAVALRHDDGPDVALWRFELDTETWTQLTPAQGGIDWSFRFAGEAWIATSQTWNAGYCMPETYPMEQATTFGDGTYVFEAGGDVEPLTIEPSWTWVAPSQSGRCLFHVSYGATWGEWADYDFIDLTTGEATTFQVPHGDHAWLAY